MPIFVTDFDGTLTREDFFWLVLQRLNPPGAQDFWDGFKARRLNHFQALSGIFGTLGAVGVSEEEVRDLVRQLDPPDDLGEQAAALRAAGWELIVASAGCGWYIEQILEQHGVEATVHASPGTFSEETGLVMTQALDNPFCSASTGVDKVAIVKDALARDSVVAYAGDSGTDRQASLLVQPEWRFATGWLASRFEKDGVSFRRFEIWTDVAEALLAAGGG
jgi:2-hydroxy-3-keto-5-methylthiopentenyl-1-phosphate phosphatase